MTYARNSLEWLEENTCSCGAGHGSGEGHVEWCTWLRIEKFTAAAKAAKEFLATPSLAKLRVRGKMMTRKQIIANL